MNHKEDNITKQSDLIDKKRDVYMMAEYEAILNVLGGYDMIEKGVMVYNTK